MNDKQLVYWYSCACDVRSKYCDEFHRVAALVPTSVLNEYAQTGSEVAS